ncbi:THAP domain-containing protein 1-like [Aplysia californica]|uniref:THAP domain-containing protein 1-like n=1 Tax=Aplysia californica TaxID=6500 RepID=A0ABM1A3S3_APLCA|nr:THAP domain-containing protein 1-like [Aplysia californica]
MPKKNDKVCSEHFLPIDYVDGKERHTLNGKAVPSKFPGYPAHKQQADKKRPSPNKRKLPLPEEPSPKRPTLNPSVSVGLDHTYHSPSTEVKVQQLQKKWKEACGKLKEKNREVKLLSEKLKRRESKISTLLEKLQELKLINEEHCEILKENFPENTFLLIENELAQQGKLKSQLRYSDEIKAFAVTLHYYSAAAYEYLSTFLHLPHAASIRRWVS